MKRFLTILACLAITASVASAQNDEYKHWFLQLQGGVAHTVGEADWTDLLSPSAAVSLGYQFSPVFSTRLNVNGWQGKGAIQDNLYKYNFLEGGLDLMADLANLFGNNRTDRTLNPYLLAGIAANYAFNNDEANDYKSLFPTTDNYLWDGSKILGAAKAGLGLNIRLSNAVDLNLEGNTSFIGDHFNSKKGSKVDYQTAILAGLVFHFGRGKKAAAAAPVVVPTPAPAPQPEPEPEPQPEPEPYVAPEPAPAAPAFEGLTENILFDINKWNIRSSEQPKIDAIVAALKDNPETSVVISGYADKDTGTASRNQFLSEHRSAEVSKALVAAGIDESRISTKYYGDTVNPFNTPEANRVAVCVVE